MDALERAIAMTARLVAFDTESSKSNLALIDFVEAYLREQGVPFARAPNATGDKAAIFATIGPMIAGGVLLLVIVIALVATVVAAMPLGYLVAGLFYYFRQEEPSTSASYSIDQGQESGAQRRGSSEGPSSDQCLCETFYYALQDANYNVLAVVESDGDVKERYEYTPYGRRTVYKSAGSYDTLVSAPILESQRVQVSSVDQAYSICDVGHQGLFHDKETGLIHNRARTLHPRLGRFLQHDPLRPHDVRITGHRDAWAISLSASVPEKK